jgi:hypothetical protein
MRHVSHETARAPPIGHAEDQEQQSSGRMETIMTKAILMLGAAFVAAGVTISTTAAEARGLRFGLGLGVGIGLGLGAAGALQNRRHHHHHYRYREPRHVAPAPRYTQPQPYKAARPTPVPAAPQATGTVRYADNMGRVYDPASGLWHDGQNRCWGGKYQWTFKNGTWLYGSHSWFPASGSWQTNAPEPPSPIDCRSSPAFASSSGGAPGQKEVGGYADQGEPAEPRAVHSSAPTPAKTADKAEPAAPRATADGTCKKYLPSVGQMVAVPCTF